MDSDNVVLKDVYEEEEMTLEEGPISLEAENSMFVSRPFKRNRPDEEVSEEEEWEVVKGKGKKLKEMGSKKETHDKNNINKKTEIYISSKEPMPKQFALARLLRAQNITEISSIKYLNPYKIKIQLEDEKLIESFTINEEFKKMEWRISKPTEVSYSYGVMKDVDMDLSVEEIMKNITCPDTVKLVSIHRLNRRNRDGEGWTPSESVRLCFEGSYLPTFVYVHGVKIIIEPYVYPVTQCSICWKLGHTLKMCSTKKTTCPKCSSTEHGNCETKVFRCVNCSGNHMALARTCPAYIKERKIRQIMSDFNCTYIKAAQKYASAPIIIPSEPKSDAQAKLKVVTSTSASDSWSQNKPSYSDVIKENLDDGSEKSVIIQSSKPKKKSSQKKKSAQSEPERMNWSQISEEMGNEAMSCDNRNYSDEQEAEKITFNELLYRIREIIFFKNYDFQTKVKSVIKLCIEWIILVTVDNISDWPMLKLILSFISSNG